MQHVVNAGTNLVLKQVCTDRLVDQNEIGVKFPYIWSHIQEIESHKNGQTVT